MNQVVTLTAVAFTKWLEVVLGRMPLAMRRTLDIDAGMHSKSRLTAKLDPQTAQLVFKREILRHNAPVLAAAIKAKVIDGDGVEYGRPWPSH